MKLKVAVSKQHLTHADKFDGCPIVDSYEKATELMRPFDFEGCSVWRYHARYKHWRLIFDTSVADASRLPGAKYWSNIVVARA